ncbi:TfoX/Sxy family DNA transformation protein [Orbaceae bacterium ac157xtp]
MRCSKNSIIMKLNQIVPDSELDFFYTKTLFGSGYSIYYKRVMFAWVYDCALHLKGHKEYVDRFTELGMTALSYDTGVNIRLLNYYKITAKIWADDELLKMLVLMVLEHENKSKELIRKLKEERIKDLPNMNLSLERTMYRIGINTVANLREIGAITAYHRLKTNQRNITTNILYAIHCALIGKHVYLLTEAEKRTLNEEYQRYIESV